MFHLCLVIQRSSAPLVGDTLSASLLKCGIKTFVVQGYAAADDLLQQMRFDLVVLEDAGDALDVTAAIVARLSVSNIPTFVVRDTVQEAEQIRLLEAGAWEVIARADAASPVTAIKAMKAARVARAESTAVPAGLTVGPLQLDAAAMVASVHGAPIDISPKQFDLLFLLAARVGKLVHRSVLERSLGMAAGEGGRGVDMQLSRLRKALRDASGEAVALLSVYGFGYSLQVESETAPQ